MLKSSSQTVKLVCCKIVVHLFISTFNNDLAAIQGSDGVNNILGYLQQL